MRPYLTSPSPSVIFSTNGDKIWVARPDRARSTAAVLPRYGEPMSETRSIRSAIKTPDTWWPTVFSGPAANRLIAAVHGIAVVTPNRITAVSLAVGLVNGALYA